MTAVKSESRTERAGAIFGGVLSLTVSALIVKFLGLVYKIPLASILGDLGMGYFNSAYTVYAFFYLLCTAGVPKAIMILVSRAKVQGGAVDEEHIIKAATGLFFTLGTVFSIALIVFSAPLARLIGNSRSAFTMLAIAPSIVFVSLSGVIRGYLNANFKLLDIAVSQVIEGVGKLVLGLAFAGIGIRTNMPIHILSAMTVLGVTLGAVLGLAYLCICSKIKIKKEKIRQRIKWNEAKGIIRQILSISVPITLSAAIMSITGLIDLAVIMRNLTKTGISETDASALYGNYTTLAVPMLNLALSIVTPISVAHLPLFSAALERRDYDGLLTAEKSATELTSILAAPMTVGLMIFGREILDLLFPMSQTDLGAELLFLLSPAVIFSSLLMTQNTLLEAAGRLRAPVISMSFGCVVKILVSSFLISRTDLGILGAPIGTVACYAASFIVSLIIYRRTLKAMPPIIQCSAIYYIAALVSVLSAKYLYLRLVFILDERILLILSILFAALIYLALLAFIALLSPKSGLKMAIYTKKRA